MEPMLCKKGEKDLLSSKDYLFQPKLDGTRAIYEDGKLINRRGYNIAERYPELQEMDIKNESIIDGEIIIYNKQGLPDFSLLQSREQTTSSFKIEHLSSKYPATYVVFDCLQYEGKNVTKKQIEKRLELLQKSVVEKKDKLLQLIFTTENGKALWEKIQEMGIEGVIAKKKGSKYIPGKRSSLWLKIKNLKTIDCVILGYTQGEGKRANTFGALIIGAYLDEKLKSLGKVGTGWTDDELIRLRKKMDNLEIERKEDKVLIEPELVCEVEYLEMTEDYHLRAPSFQRLRYDKAPEECEILHDRD